MLRDDAIREGLMDPTDEDIKRMGLTSQDMAIIKQKKQALAPPVVEALESSKTGDANKTAERPKAAHKPEH